MQLVYDHQSVDSQVSLPTYDFGIKDTRVIFDMLCNRLYSKPLHTLIQEYMCNARDANIEAKREHLPVVVTLPSTLSNQLRIRDFGPGLSPQRIHDVFIYLGESTKRHCNTQIGAFGIGAKSAWAYVRSFTIVSWHQKTKTTYLAYLDAKQRPKLSVVEQTHDEAAVSGVEIRIPIDSKDISAIPDIIRTVTLFWSTPVRIVGECTSEKSISYIDIGPDVFIITDYGKYMKDVIVNYEGIPYEVDLSTLNLPDDLCDRIQSLEYNQHLVVNMYGHEVQVNVNRESLRFDNKAKQVIAEKLEFAFQWYDTRFAREIFTSTNKCLRPAIPVRVQQGDVIVVLDSYGGKRLYHKSLHVYNVSYYDRAHTKLQYDLLNKEGLYVPSYRTLPVKVYLGYKHPKEYRSKLLDILHSKAQSSLIYIACISNEEYQKFLVPYSNFFSFEWVTNTDEDCYYLHDMLWNRTIKYPSDDYQIYYCLKKDASKVMQMLSQLTHIRDALTRKVAVVAIPKYQLKKVKGLQPVERFFQQVIKLVRLHTYVTYKNACPLVYSDVVKYTLLSMLLEMSCNLEIIHALNTLKRIGDLEHASYFTRDDQLRLLTDLKQYATPTQIHMIHRLEKRFEIMNKRIHSYLTALERYTYELPLVSFINKLLSRLVIAPDNLSELIGDAIDELVEYLIYKEECNA